MKKDKEPDYKAIRQRLFSDNQLSIKAEFVPKSRSRNKDSDDPQLNWKITLLSGTREIITTDYSQGIGHIPLFIHSERMARGSMPDSDRYHYGSYIDKVCECGKAKGFFKKDNEGKRIGHTFTKWDRKTQDGFGGHNLYAIPLDPPSLEDVLWCFISDARVLDYGSFESWCEDYGMNADSIKHNQMYQECLQIALKLRSGLGERTIADLQDAYQDY